MRVVEEESSDSDSDYDLRGIVFCLPQKTAPAWASLKRKPGGVFGPSKAKRLGPGAPGVQRKVIPVVLADQVRLGFTGWMRLYTANRGSSLTTIFRAVNNFMARLLPRLSGEHGRFTPPLDLSTLQLILESHEAELTTEVAKGSNLSLRTFWRHFARFLREAVPETIQTFIKASQSEEKELPQQAEAASLAGAGKTPGPLPRRHTSTYVPPGPDPTEAAHKKRKRKRKRRLSMPATGGAPRGGGSREQPALDPSQMSDPSLLLAPPPPPPPPPDFANMDPALLPPLPPLFPPLLSEGGGSGRGRGGGKRPRQAGVSVMDANAQRGFHYWMQNNTKMQAVSMITAMRTANRVIASMLIKHRGQVRGATPRHHLATPAHKHSRASA
jgi:hypothetical protein